MPTPPTTEDTPRKRDKTHYLYLAVIVAVALGILVGFLFPGFAKGLKPLGDGFVNLIKMMITPDHLLHRSSSASARSRRRPRSARSA